MEGGMRIGQLIPAQGWRALHVDPYDELVWEDHLVAWALCEDDDGAQMIHALGQLDIESWDPEDANRFSDQYPTFVEFSPPPSDRPLFGDPESPAALRARLLHQARVNMAREKGVILIHVRA